MILIRQCLSLTRSSNITVTAVVALAVAVLVGARAAAQEPLVADGENVVVNFSGPIDLAVVVDYVGRIAGARFLYGEELQNQRVELRPSPLRLPKARLLQLLTSLLRVRDLAMVEEEPNLYRIVRIEQTARSVSKLLSGSDLPDAASARMVTQVIEIPSGNVKAIADQIGRLMTSPKAGLVALPESGRVIVTDYESRLAMIGQLVALLGTTTQEILVETVPMAHADSETVASQVLGVITETHRAREARGSPPSVRGDLIAGALVVVGTKTQIDEALALVARFAPEITELTTVGYAPHFLSLQRLSELIDHVLLAPGSGLSHPTAMYSDTTASRLFVTAETNTHAAIEEMLTKEDEPFQETQRPLRIHRPKHRSAAELLTAVTEILGGNPTSTVASVVTTPENASANQERPPTPRGADTADTIDVATPARTLSVRGNDYVLTVDEHTNALLAIGTREFHAQLEVLIDELDRRRPQVLITMTLVAVTMSDSLDLGVELQSLDLGDAWDFVLFSNFGLSSIDPETGDRTLTPGIGGNGVLLSPDRVPLIVRALSTKAKARVMSTPKLLVADGARGTLRNVDEAPFTSVNASDTVATTSFAGFESAGTTLNVTPNILEGDYVTLEYELTFSNFSGSSSTATVPPPRTTNAFTSQVEVPDGYTLITGGLIVDNDSESVSGVPFFADIPGIGKLFQSSGRQNSHTKIFAFITPTIVREDEFEALKYITLKDVERAELKRNMEEGGGPMWMR